MQECHELGLNVNVWTVNTEELMNQMLDLGVDFITTDYPEVLQKVIFEPQAPRHLLSFTVSRPFPRGNERWQGKNTFGGRGCFLKGLKYFCEIS